MGKKRKVLRDKKGEFRYEVFFVNGKQKKRKVRLIQGVPVEEFIEKYADDVFLAQEGDYHILHARESAERK